jgi:hypothetical protein
MKKLYALFAFSIAFVFNSFAQCPTGQVNVTVDVITDNWGYECFWDITPTGNGCGNGALFTFGNTAEVNCTSGGSQVASAGGYGDNTTTTEAIGCLQVGNCFDINYVDDYGDGGAIFVVKFNGVVMQTFAATDSTVTASYAFCVSNPPVYDANISTIGSKYTMLPLSQSLNVVAPAVISSDGTGNLTGAKANVQIFKNGTQVYAFSSAPQTINTLNSGTYTFSQFTASSFGVHTFKYSSQIDQVDEVLSNDTTSYDVDITDTIYAVDDNIKEDLIGLGAGEKGYLGNSFQIIKPTQASSVSIFLGDGSQVQGVSAVDSVFKIHIFSTNPLGLPQTIIATTSGTIENVTEKWYTLSFASPVNLAPGQYVVAIEEEHHIHELGYTLAFSPLTSYISSVTQIPWAPVEDFGAPISFMIRLNLATSGLAVQELKNTDLTIYPNPVSTELTIGNTLKGAKVQIFNQLGQLVLSSETQNGTTEIDVQNLNNGFYTIKTIEENKIGIAKFVKD